MMADQGLIVTIGRLNGSGGREVGKILADRLGIGCFDQSVIRETAAGSQMSESEVYGTEEKLMTRRFSLYGIPAGNPLADMEQKQIRDIASREGTGVFVGRCADHALKGRADLVRVFIHASPEACARRSQERNSISLEEASQRTRERNEERARYYTSVTGEVWGNATHYDLAIDTTNLDPGQAAEIILLYLRMRGYVGP